MPAPDTIAIHSLRFDCYLGVPDEERATAQTIEMDIILQPREPLANLRDELVGTIDYHAVSVQIEQLAQQRPRKLIETLAEDSAAFLLKSYPLAEVSVTVRKFILSNTRCVEVSITRNNSY